VNRPLVITAIGVVVVMAAIGANFLLWQQEMGEEPMEQASAPQAAAKAAAEAAAKAAERARAAADQAATTKRAAEEAVSRADAPDASSETKEAATKAQAEAKAAEDEARRASEAANAARSVADAASQAARMTREAAATPAKPSQPGGRVKPSDAQSLAGPVAPSFDVVRINPKGDTVVAGRAAPGSKVRILDHGKVIGETTADKRGEWVFVPETPLPPGTRQLTLEAETSGTKTTSTSSVILVVPEPGKDIAGRPTDQPQQPLVLKIPDVNPEKVTIPDGPVPSVVLQKPTAGQPALVLAVDAIDYDDAGRLSISGQAQAGSLVQLYLDNGFLGRTTTGGDNRWSVTPEIRVEPGLYTLRVDQMDAAGKVVARVTLPFSRAEPLAPGAGRYVIVQPGNSLWRIARRTYGIGFQYTVIYEANAAQIADADLIYPGQIFQLPRTN
jgi:nucleoid-associated protein YgaU